MNLTSAISHLKRIGFTIIEKNGLYDVRRNGYKDASDYEGGYEPDMTPRKLIKFASTYSSLNQQNTSLKKNVKGNEKGRLRTATRNILKSKDVDLMDEKLSSNSKVVEEDIWLWD